MQVYEEIFNLQDLLPLWNIKTEISLLILLKLLHDEITEVISAF